MDPRTRDFVRINGRPYLREPLDARVDPRALPAGSRRRPRRVTIRPLLPETRRSSRRSTARTASSSPRSSRCGRRTSSPQKASGSGSRRRAADGFHQFAIVDGGGIAGTINLFRHRPGRPCRAATIGYWVDQRAQRPRPRDRRGRRDPRATRSTSSTCTESRRRRSSTTCPRSACSRRTASSGSASRAASSASTTSGATSCSFNAWRTTSRFRSCCAAPSTSCIHGSRRLIQSSACGRSSNGASSSEPSWISTPSGSRTKRREPQRGQKLSRVVGRVLAGRLEGVQRPLAVDGVGAARPLPAVGAVAAADVERLAADRVAHCAADAAAAAHSLLHRGNLDALRIDVDDRREAGAAHRRCGRCEQRRGTGGERARPVGLADELCAMAAAQPQQAGPGRAARTPAAPPSAPRARESRRRPPARRRAMRTRWRNGG